MILIRRAITALVVLALLAGTASRAHANGDNTKISPALLTLMQADPTRLLPVIVEMQPPSFPFAPGASGARANEALDLLRLNGRAVGGLALINSAAGFANALGIQAISLVPTVAYVHHDATVRPSVATAERSGRHAEIPPLPTPTPVPTPIPTPIPLPTPVPTPTPTPPPPPPPTPAATSWPAVYPAVIHATALWSQDVRGQGVTVAVLDSGVAPDIDLVSPTNRILASVNFSDQRVSADPGGHGTHIAGTIAGNGARSAGEFVGVAPGANIVDVRVLTTTGGGRVSSVVRGIEWVVAHRSAYNIRVINMSFGAPASGSYRTDPLAAAVEIAWRLGIVVVAASGNTGPARDTVVSPGTDPYAITVGATDDAGTLTLGDDVLAWFSSWGTPDSNAKPDLVAPGRRIVAPRVPGSTLDTLFPDRVVTARNGATYFRLSGTSMATGVVSGAVALLLQARPDLRPDDVKALLVGRTQPFGQESGVTPPAGASGSGALDIYAATTGMSSEPTSPQTTTKVLDPIVTSGVAVPPTGTATTSPASTPSASAVAPQTLLPPPAPVNRALRPANAFARSAYSALYGLPLRWKDPNLGGIAWSTLTWESVAWDSVAWDNYDWDSVAWDSVAWDSVAWDSVAWDSVAWDSVAWDSVAWDAFTFD